MARMLGMDKTGQTQVNFSMSLVGLLSEMPPAARRAVIRHDVSDAEVVGGAALTEKKVDVVEVAEVAEAPEDALAERPAGVSPPKSPPGRSVQGLI